MQGAELFEKIRVGIRVRDTDFDQLYPTRLHGVADTHFTPIQVAKSSAKWLAKKTGTRVLDVGSGTGKFCLIGASCTGGIFTGIEQRKGLHLLAKKMARTYGIERTHFIHGNVLDLPFSKFDAIYLYNPFQEHLFPKEAIDEAIDIDRSLYRTYSAYVHAQLAAMPPGTRLATFHSHLKEIPKTFSLRKELYLQHLKLWVKEE
jgi:SAM-dependent methyltransferase